MRTYLPKNVKLNLQPQHLTVRPPAALERSHLHAKSLELVRRPG
jgi:hypothetical protein